MGAPQLSSGGGFTEPVLFTPPTTQMPDTESMVVLLLEVNAGLHVELTKTPPAPVTRLTELPLSVKGSSGQPGYLQPGIVATRALPSYQGVGLGGTARAMA